MHRHTHAFIDIHTSYIEDIYCMWWWYQSVSINLSRKISNRSVRFSRAYEYLYLPVFSVCERTLYRRQHQQSKSGKVNNRMQGFSTIVQCIHKYSVADVYNNSNITSSGTHWTERKRQWMAGDGAHTQRLLMFSKSSLPLVWWSSFVIAADKYIPTNDYRLVVQFETQNHTPKPL